METLRASSEPLGPLNIRSRGPVHDRRHGSGLFCLRNGLALQRRSQLVVVVERHVLGSHIRSVVLAIQLHLVGLIELFVNVQSA